MCYQAHIIVDLWCLVNQLCLCGTKLTLCYVYHLKKASKLHIHWRLLVLLHWHFWSVITSVIWYIVLLYNTFNSQFYCSICHTLPVMVVTETKNCNSNFTLALVFSYTMYSANNCVRVFVIASITYTSLQTTKKQANHAEYSN